MPRFRRLEASDVQQKAEGDLVTTADLAAERQLADGLAGLMPHAAFVGEETVADNPAVADALARPGAAWVVDPLDGTAHYAVGEEPFGVIVALVVDGVTERGWIYLPKVGTMAMAQRGNGAFVDGRQVSTTDARTRPVPRGGLHSRFVPEAVRASAVAAGKDLHTVSGERCAAKRYIELLLDREDFSMWWRTAPWDHAAGCLLVQEAGGCARRPDGSAYQPSDGAEGLLVTRSPAAWDDLAGRLLPD